jgi:hypothetical protein
LFYTGGDTLEPDALIAFYPVIAIETSRWDKLRDDQSRYANWPSVLKKWEPYSIEIGDRNDEYDEYIQPHVGIPLETGIPNETVENLMLRGIEQMVKNTDTFETDYVQYDNTLHSLKKVGDDNHGTYFSRLAHYANEPGIGMKPNATLYGDVNAESRKLLGTTHAVMVKLVATEKIESGTEIVWCYNNGPITDDSSYNRSYPFPRCCANPFI